MCLLLTLSSLSLSLFFPLLPPVFPVSHSLLSHTFCFSASLFSLKVKAPEGGGSEGRRRRRSEDQKERRIRDKEMKKEIEEIGFLFFLF